MKPKADPPDFASQLPLKLHQPIRLSLGAYFRASQNQTLLSIPISRLRYGG